MQDTKRIALLAVSAAVALCAAAAVLGHRQVPQPPTLETAAPTAVPASGSSWGLSFQEEGAAPIGNAAPEELRPYDAYYVGNPQKKVLYLTFDCGYDNGNTAKILDTLKKHHTPAAFFVVGNMVESAPEIVQRMAREGHIVGNHTYHHPDMSQLAGQDAFRKELEDLSALYEKTTGRPLDPFYRPPQGKYSEEALRQAQALGYQTIFWSLAYVDWEQEHQPTQEEAFEKLLPRLHNGAILLLHATSSTNAQILDALLTRCEEMGYTFAPLTALKEG